ncbi:hypothetical protein F2Q70_00017644 [Brassica cretica]|uniref:Uncharacterized protein n=1 Tax=Brassica cretica TaxID=69181 RepID=A0A8S9HR05_BRACR|nr:hypothetical protein F2Q70_00017644 [Brassica cretica]KAF2600681.1 hypothetical protein F2Q68_00010580 [Brassica cretica]
MDLRPNTVSSHDLRVQSRSQEPTGSNYDLRIYQRTSWFPNDLRVPDTISRSKREPPGSPTTFGSQTRSQDLKENFQVPLRPCGLKEDLRDPRRPSGPHATSRLQDSKSPYSRKLETPGFIAHLSGRSRSLKIPRLSPDPCVICKSGTIPIQRLSSTNC